MYYRIHQIANLLSKFSPTISIGSEVNGDRSSTARLEYLSGVICCIRRFQIPAVLEEVDFDVSCSTGSRITQRESDKINLKVSKGC